MNFLTNLSIGGRLAAGFAIILLLSLTSIVAGLASLSAVARATDNMVRSALVKERLVSDWHGNIFAGVKRTISRWRSALFACRATMCGPYRFTRRCVFRPLHQLSLRLSCPFKRQFNRPQLLMRQTSRMTDNMPTSMGSDSFEAR